MKEKLDYKKVFETMVSETEKYLKKFNLKAMILGISGGIDSTVTAAICCEVVKRNPDIKFIGVSLPCTTNSKEENTSALATMKAFCPEGWTENLEECYQKVLETTRKTLPSDTPISQGNIKARLRMIYLYNLASVTGGLVMDTDNLTEHYLGFFTIHGDVADFNPIGGLWKHEVYELAAHLKDVYLKEQDNDKIVAMTCGIKILPTDGNGVQAGGDMAQIAPGHTYDEVDDILETFIEEIKPCWSTLKNGINEPTEELNAVYEKLQELNTKYGEETVERVIKRHLGSEYKRKRLPIAIGRDLYEE